LTALVYYVGDADERIMRTSDFVAAGVVDQTTVVFDAGNSWSRTVSNSANTWLLTLADFAAAGITRTSDVDVTPDDTSLEQLATRVAQILSGDFITGAPGPLPATASLISFASGSYNATDVEAALIEILQRLTDVTPIDIRKPEYGAVCDGIVDDSAAIQAAIDAAGRSTGAVTIAPVPILIPALCAIGSTIHIAQQSIHLLGQGIASGLKWIGAAGGTMIDVQDATSVAITDMSILGSDTNPPGVGIWFNTPTVPLVGTLEYCSVVNCNFGRQYTTQTGSPRGAMAIGIKFGGLSIGNNDTWRVENCNFYDCSTAGIHIANEQAIWGNIDNPLFVSCGYGVKAEGSTVMTNAHFNHSVTADMYVDDGTVNVNGYWSEHAALFWDQKSNSTLVINGGRISMMAEMATDYYAKSVVSDGNHLDIIGLKVVNNLANPAKLKISGSSSNTTESYVLLRGNVLPSGTTDAGYEIDGFVNGTPLHIDISQGAYWRRQVVKSTDAAGVITLPPRTATFRTGVIATTIDRDAAAGSLILTSGQLYCVAIDIPYGKLITSISFYTTVTLVSPTHQWFGLFDAAGGLPDLALMFTNDDTNVAWAQNTRKTLNLTTAYRTTKDGLHYLGIMVAAGTAPTLPGKASTTFMLGSTGPNLSSKWDTGLTTPPTLPFTPSSGTTVATRPYAEVS
jgi:hypothetical protein